MDVARREMLGASVAALAAAPLAGLAPISPKHPAPMPRPRPLTPAPPVRSSLTREAAPWVAGEVAPAAIALQGGYATRDHLLRASAAVRMFALRLESFRFDLAAPYIASKIPTNKTDYPDLPVIDAAHAFLTRFDPGLPREAVAAPFRFTPATLASARESLSRNGFTWHLHSAADLLHSASRLAPADIVARPAEAASGTMLYIEKVSFSPARPAPPPPQLTSIAKFCYRVLCTAIEDKLSSALAGALSSAIVGLSVSSACVGLATVVGDAIAAVAACPECMFFTDPIAEEICQFLASNLGGPNAIVTTGALTAIISTALSSVASGIGC